MAHFSDLSDFVQQLPKTETHLHLEGSLPLELARKLDPEKFAEPPPFSEQPRGVLDFFMLQLSKLDWQKGLIIVGVLACVIVGVSIIVMARHHRKADPLSGLKPAMYQNTQRLSGEKLPLPRPAPAKKSQ